VHPTPAPGATTNDPFGRKRPRSRIRQKLSSALAAVVALVAKFGVAIKGILIALPNLKLFITAGTALVSVAAYSLFFGWWFAVGFVVLIFVHEMGHVIALRREGIKASAPTFIPFLGAIITARSLGDNALAEARVGLAGPILGSLGAACVAVAGALLDSNFLLALAYIGFFINLFNLLPVVPLDGGRAMAAMAPWMWFVGFGVLVALMGVDVLEGSGNPILPIIVLFAAFDLLRRWRHRKSRTLQAAAYYRVSPRNRAIIGVVYVGLIVALVFGMDATHILASGSHSFRSI
jgi:Zn-dependent protease